jgi:hypothetical protein
MQVEFNVVFWPRLQRGLVTHLAVYARSHGRPVCLRVHF